MSRMTTMLLIFVLAMACGVQSQPSGHSEGNAGDADSSGEVRSTELERVLKNPPVFAIWMDSEGYIAPGKSRGLYLRAAIWEDGTVMFGEDAKQRSHRVKSGRMSGGELQRVEASILATGVLDLKGYCYLVPDQPVICMLVNLDGRQQILYWDEVENPLYGLNTHPTPNYLAFKEAWHKLNNIAVSCRPEGAISLSGEFSEAPKAWYVKKAIQSE